MQPTSHTNGTANGMTNGKPRQPVMRGLIAAPYTPFDRQTLDVKLDTIERYVELLVRDGVTGAFICGTTGEGVSLTMEERMAVATRWVEVAGKSLNIIFHVGDLAQRNSVALATHARKIKAAGVAAMPAFFFKPSGASQALDFVKPIAEAAGEVPFYYYHIPSMNGVALSVHELLGMAKDRVPNLRGVKYTHPDLMEFNRLTATYADHFELAWGVDEVLLAGLGMGATAAVGSTYNYAAPLYKKMISAFRAGDLDEARSCSNKVAEMVAILIKLGGGVRVGKASMQMIGLDCGPTRSPVLPLTTEEYATVKAAYERLDCLTSPLTSGSTATRAASAREVAVS